MFVYRLGSGRYPANDRLGASLYGGQWNHKGTPVIYAASSRALCALEVLANVNGLAGYVVTPIELPGDLAVITLSVDAIPPVWNAAQPSPKRPTLAQRGPKGSRVWRLASGSFRGYPTAFRFFQAPFSHIGAVRFR